MNKGIPRACTGCQSKGKCEHEATTCENALYYFVKNMEPPTCSLRVEQPDRGGR